MSTQLNLDIHEEMIIDNFAGGGGASTGIEMALGRRVDVSINHDPMAVAMHRANHPETKHYCESVWAVDPRQITKGRKVGLVWLSPDCKHFSKAKGGKPVEKKIRGLAWVALKWASLPYQQKPRVIMLENVEEFVTWGPLVKDADGNMRPCKKNKGREFKAFVNALKRQGYQVEWKELRASEYATPTIRKRLFLIARSDGRPIVWPAAATGNPAKIKGSGLKPWRTAAEIIDWSIPCPSIFLTKEEGRTLGVKRPLAPATMKRIALGVMRYVVNAAEPFIVTAAHGEVSPSGAKRWGKGHRSADMPLPTVTASGGYAVIAPVLTEHANASNPRSFPADEPLRTICAQVKGGHHALVTGLLTKYHGDSAGSPADHPFPTITASSFNKRPGGNPPLAVVSAHLAKHYTGVVGADMRDPLPTATCQDHNAVVTSHLVKLRNNQDGQAIEEPMPTLTAGGGHVGEVRAFLIKYYGTDQDPQLKHPLHTVTTKDRYGLVTVAGQEYAIADIGMRMLTPRELFRAQGFPEHYIIEWGIDEHGKKISLTKTDQVRMCGNSVCPPLAAALVQANLPELMVKERKAA